MALNDESIVINNSKSYIPLPASEVTPTYTESKLNKWLNNGLSRTAEFLGLGNDYQNIIKYFQRWNNIGEDPTVLLYTIKSILTDGVVKLPPNMTTEELRNLKNALEGWYAGLDSSKYAQPRSIPDSEVDQKMMDRNYMAEMPIKPDSYIPIADKDIYEKVVDIPSPETEVQKQVQLKPGMDQTNPAWKKYNWVYDSPYSGGKDVITASNPEQLIKELNSNSRGYGIGYKYVQGFEMGSTAKWNIQLYPYSNTNKGINTGFPSDSGRYCLVPPLPEYTLPLPGNEKGQTFSFSKYCPVLSWNLNYGTMDSMNLPLFNGSSMQIPNGFRYSMVLNLSILDDVYLSMDKYFRNYLNSIYKPADSAMAPYWATLFWIPITIFTPNYDINYRFNLIGAPINYTPQYEGSDNTSDEARISIDFSIVGIQTYSKPDAKVFPKGIKGGNKNGLTWNNITLRP